MYLEHLISQPIPHCSHSIKLISRCIESWGGIQASNLFPGNGFKVGIQSSKKTTEDYNFENYPQTLRISPVEQFGPWIPIWKP